MRTINLNLYTFAELNKDAQLKATASISTLLEDVLSHHIDEITDSYKAFCAALSGCTDTLLANKGDCPLTGVYYDYDFISLLDEPSLNYEVSAQKLLLKLKRDNRRWMYSVDSIDQLCIANEIEFLACGTVFNVNN